uniref:RAB34, member RAS oncogene family n=1 Tax=Pipistrellus kuhlii TaxID=59472 RepID=A0A7J7SN29_PIPKU|nr:RAB34, member RAS oncogene family [Pipistrellus kuhlii]
MNLLAPVRRDRVLAELPQYLRKEAALHTRRDFHPRVTCACQEHRTGTVGRFKISKVIVVGDLSVGKTCLINRFCKDTFDKNYKATIGVDFEMERFEVLGIPFSLQLWDTAGQERFKCIASTYYRGAQAIIIVFNLNDVASLEHTKFQEGPEYARSVCADGERRAQGGPRDEGRVLGSLVAHG